jgi:6,7-dimethyl-8-ribityllumazine synthase
MERKADPIFVRTEGARILLVAARYYADIVDQLILGARRAVEEGGAAVELIEVPGAFEAPGAIALAEKAGRFDGYVALGCVIRGETSHYDYVCGESARGLMDLSLAGVPVGYGILTVEDAAQAAERADPEGRDKGGEAARACLALLALKRRFAGAAR